MLIFCQCVSDTNFGRIRSCLHTTLRSRKCIPSLNTNTKLHPPIIHRIIEKGDNWVSTKGDNNPTQLNFEKQIHKDDILGVAKIKIPFIGWVKVGFLMLLGKI